MNQTMLMSKIDRLLDNASTAVMATADMEGRPHMRWMTPGVLRNRPYSLFCVTSPTSYKTLAVKNPSPVSWMIQNKQLTEIVNCQGDLYMVEDPSIEAEVLEHVSKKLVVFWKVNEMPSEFVVLETVLTEGSYFRPMDNVREFTTFQEKS